MNKLLVVYYSWIGNTKVVAEEIQKATGADLERIEEVKERIPGKGFAQAAMGAVFGLKSKLRRDIGFAGYDAIFLGAQVWAGKSTPAINAFLAKGDFKDKRVYLFITKADDKVPQKVVDSIAARIERKGGKVIDVLSVTTKTAEAIQPEAVTEQVRSWVGSLKL